MRVEFDPSCQNCEARPSCEVAAQNATKLEVAARDLGFRVTEGSVTCVGREALPEPFGPFECRASYHDPALASEGERANISALDELDKKAAAIWPGVNEHVREVRDLIRAREFNS